VSEPLISFFGLTGPTLMSGSLFSYAEEVFYAAAAESAANHFFAGDLLGRISR
jgi:hypothetical protein